MDINTPRKRPYDRDIAFAVSLVASKPDGLTVREYIRLLRQHVAKGRRENALSSVYRHLDRSSYWRAECERVQVLNACAEAKAVDLRREIDTLKAKLENAKVSPTKKRKKIEEDVILAPRPPKKARRDGSPGRRPGTLAAIDLEKDFDFADTGEIGNILMRSLFQVHAILKAHRSPDPVALAHHLVRAASALPQVLQHALMRGRSYLPASSEGLITALTAAGRAVASIIVGFSRLVTSTDGRQTEGQVIHAILQMFGKLLDVFQDASASEARKAAATENQPPSTAKSSPTKSKGKARPPRAVHMRDNSSLNSITTFLRGIIDLLEPNIEAHRALFEGIAYSTLDKLGARLYHLTFGRARAKSLSEDIRRSNLPDEIEDTPSSLPPEDQGLRQAKLEAPYLIQLLIRVLNKAPAFLGSAVSAKIGKAKQANHNGSMKGALAIHAKDRLQRTLVNCMFGTEDMDVNDPFMDCLKMAVLSGQALPMPKVKEPEVQEWFREELWRLLGWEILGKEGNW